MVTVNGIKYYLTKEELRKLKAACKYMNLAWEAQAARPQVALRLIRQYHGILMGWSV
jgi:hypothetical protein